MERAEEREEYSVSERGRERPNSTVHFLFATVSWILRLLLLPSQSLVFLPPQKIFRIDPPTTETASDPGPLSKGFRAELLIGEGQCAASSRTWLQREKESEDSQCGKTRPAAVAALIQRERVLGFSIQEKERTSLGRSFDGFDANFPSSVIAGDDIDTPGGGEVEEAGSRWLLWFAEMCCE